MMSMAFVIFYHGGCVYADCVFMFPGHWSRRIAQVGYCHAGMVVDYGYGYGNWQMALVTKTVDNQ
jgi:hypothetical protein